MHVFNLLAGLRYMPILFLNGNQSTAGTCVRSFRTQVSLNAIKSIIISITAHAFKTSNTMHSDNQKYLAFLDTRYKKYFMPINTIPQYL